VQNVTCIGISTYSARVTSDIGQLGLVYFAISVAGVSLDILCLALSPSCFPLPLHSMATLCSVIAYLTSIQNTCVHSRGTTVKRRTIYIFLSSNSLFIDTNTRLGITEDMMLLLFFRQSN
jgi:hypothetical protein